MRERIAGSGVLQLDGIHPHWHILPTAPLAAEPLVLELATVAGKGRPSLRQSRPGPSRSRQPQIPLAVIHQLLRDLLESLRNKPSLLSE
jgi:hypothetical protein